MTKAKILCCFFIISFLTGCAIFVTCLMLTNTVDHRIGFSGRLYSRAENTLISVMEDSAGNGFSGEIDGKDRLSQQVAVEIGDREFPVSGTLTKVRDAFYPGTYEISFSKDMVLTTSAQVKVSMDVKAGDKVYVLIGDKESGYTEYTTVECTEDRKVSFYTNILQDYTISTTDICAAQKTVADLLSPKYIY